MKREEIKKVMIFDQNSIEKGDSVFFQMMSKAKEVFVDSHVRFIRVGGEDTCNPEMAAMIIEAAVKDESPDLLLIGATSLGEQIAPALGVRLHTGVAAHCVDITVNKEGCMAYMVPAFGGKFIGEIFIPGNNYAIVTVKPGVFAGDERQAGAYETLHISVEEAAVKTGRAEKTYGEQGRHYHGYKPAFRLTGKEEKTHDRNPMEKAKLVLCGGFGIGSGENWQKLELLADRLGGGIGCTRPVSDTEWGPDEGAMIGTSGKTIRPKVYVGFGVSGAAHHVCGIKDTDTIININNDKDAEVFASSDYKAVIDAGMVIDSLLQKNGGK